MMIDLIWYFKIVQFGIAPAVHYNYNAALRGLIRVADLHKN